MPGALILEAMAQVGGVALLSLPENRGKIALFGGVKNARFKRQVIPGDVLELECTLTKRRGPVGIGVCTAAVNGLVTTVVVEFAAVTASAAADVFCAAIVAPAPIIAQVKPSAIPPIIFRNFITAVPPSGSKIEFHAAVRISGVQSVFPTGYAFIISAFFVFVMNDF